jgi:SAM-dependent methyltransferase
MNQHPAKPPTQIAYESMDLELFAKAKNWKKYWSDKVRSYIRGRVIEVGAGLGASTEYMCEQEYPEWICLDPDPSNSSHLARRIASGELPAFCKAECCVLEDLAPSVMADTILYIDVLEHIKDDEAEMRVAVSHLRQGGHVIVLCPAFNFLYTPFDKAVGHHRRYDKGDIERLTAPGLALREVFFLDSVGFFASLANRIFLKSSMPSSGQIALWDRAMIPVSRYADGAFGAIFGKTIVLVWHKPDL